MNPVLALCDPLTCRMCAPRSLVLMTLGAPALALKGLRGRRLA
jgi:hypothetical protein